MTEIVATYLCSYCLQENDVFVDISQGLTQTLTEDCAVCCRSNELHIRVDAETNEAFVESEIEG
ncbi:MAG: CPXCG motif-containing cysteine-rich protein [Bacteroidota bacterium]